MLRKILWMLPLVLTVAVVMAGGSAQRSKDKRAMPRMEITVASRYDFDRTVEELKKAAVAEQYPVQGVHELSKILTSKGFPRERLTIVEVCNAKMASESLKQDIMVGLMMPCPVMVFERNGRVFVSTFDTRLMAKMYDGPRMGEISAEVNRSLRKILGHVARSAPR